MEMEEFFNCINSLKHTERQGWKDRDIERPLDTIASHSFGAGLIGWFLAEKEDLETDRIIKMLLVHDLIMAYVDDYTPADSEFGSKKQKEQEMAEKLFQNIPDELEKEFRELFYELQEKRLRRQNWPRRLINLIHFSRPESIQLKRIKTS